MAFDPWQPYNQGLANLGQTIQGLGQQDLQRQEATRRNSLADLQMQQGNMELNRAQAGDTALMNVTGTRNLPDAMTAQAKAGAEAAQREELLKRSAKHAEALKAYKTAGATPEFMQEFTKMEMKQHPSTAPLADFVSFVDDTKMEITKPFKDGELKDPMTGQPFPAGTYKIVSRATGNPAEPYKFDKIEPVIDKMEKGFDQIDLGNKVKIIPRDGSAPYFEKKGITPGAAARITINQGGGDNEDVDAWAKAISEGRANLSDVPNRGTVRSRVVKALEKTGGVDYAGQKAENAAYGASLTQQQKQVGAMGSFVKNIDKQVNRFEEVSKEIASFDTRLLNIPLRAVRGRIAGSPNQAKLDMYLTEISAETGKLASGATGSVAELSQGAREKWEKIHDPNLSIKDLLSLLKETKHAGQMRMDSVKEQINDTRQSRGSGNVRKIGKYAVEVH